jgi:NADH:ubiquinone reductase (H+-translocating)
MIDDHDRADSGPALGREGTADTSDSRPQVLIVGAGFGGLAAAKALRRVPVRVTLVDQHDYHTFTPFLYQVATALLEADNAAYPVRGRVRRLGNVSFRLSTVTGIDLDGKAVETDRARLPYDYLVLAAGAVNAYFAHAEIAERSLGHAVAQHRPGPVRGRGLGE